jgi:hypothetical protein
MSESLRKQSSTLETLARIRFPVLTACEIRLLHAATNANQVAIGGPSDSYDDPINDPSTADNWGSEREVRAELIRWLCVDAKARTYVDPQGIRIFAAKVVNELNLSYVTVPFPLSIRRCALTENAIMRSVEIPALDLSGCWVLSLDAQGSRVKGDLFLRDRFRAKGMVQLMGAQIGGDLDCSGGKFVNPPTKESSETGIAIAADGITVGGQILLDTFSPGNSFHAEGEVHFLHAQVGINFDCQGGLFINPPITGVPTSGKSLTADGIIVKGTVFLNKGPHSVGFYSEGEVRLVDAQIGGSLECEGGTFSSGLKRKAGGRSQDGGDPALTVERTLIKGDVIFGVSPEGNGQPVPYRGTVIFLGKFQADGAVSLAGTRIEGNLDLRKSLLRKTELILERTTTGSLMYSGGNWPQLGNLFLDGFVYGRIADGPADAETTLKLLSLQPEQPFRPQPFLQLAKVLRESGDDDGERRVLVAMEDHRWKADHTSTYSFRLPFRVIAGYGYRPLWAAWEILGLSALGWIVYRRSYLAGTMVPTEKDACRSFREEAHPPDYYPKFSPLIYSVENSLPLVKLGQADKWQPDPAEENSGRKLPSSISDVRSKALPRWISRILTLAAAARSRLSKLGTSGRFLRWFVWFQILLGWLLATFFIAGVTGLVRKE